MFRKPILHDKVVTLRKEGFSYNEISESVKVAKSTISRWCHSIILTEKQEDRLTNKKRNTPLILELQNRAIKTRKEAKIWASQKIEGLRKNRKQLLLISGILLYWAEGTKGKQQCIEFTNTDGRIIKIMMSFFREILLVPDNKFRLMVRIGEHGNVKEAEEYWYKLTKITKTSFHKPEILKLTEKSKSLQRYPYGICRLNIYDVIFYRRIIELIEEFNKNLPL